MSSLFGGKPDNSAAEKRIADQEKRLKVQEANQAKELASRRRSQAGGGQRSKTLFSQVLGTDESIGKQTKLGS